MPFESLSEQTEILIKDFPAKWLPLIYLYDPDLPLYPLLYFHCLDPDLAAGARPGELDRVFGFVHHVNLEGSVLRVSVALNKDLSKEIHARYRPVVEQAIRSRLGLGDPIALNDLVGSLKGKLSNANSLLKELWYKIVDPSFGKSLPFGLIWDPVVGLVRCIASWFSEGGRKGELIQTHYFLSSFGQRIATGGDIHVDFYLLPTFEEFNDISNPLSLFPRFANLVTAAKNFCAQHCTTRTFGNLKFSAFELSTANMGTSLDTKVVLGIIAAASGRLKDALFENFSAFNRGPQRSIIALMMFNDLRNGLWHPKNLNPANCALMYTELRRSYQTPKVIQLYSQHCFGIAAALPHDIWVKTFLSAPLGFRATAKSKYYSELFDCSDVWGKIERLIWLAAQARKVHSSVCAEILWCIRYGTPGSKKLPAKMRGANPLGCKICEHHIRAVCPAHQSIKNKIVGFNSPAGAAVDFRIETSAANNTTASQSFVCCKGAEGEDDYSARDRPEKFLLFPISGHKGSDMSVDDFIAKY